MSAPIRQLVIPLARRARLLAWPRFAKNYRENPAGSSSLALKVLGIADTSYRPAFAALANAVEKTCHLGGHMIECGVFRGGTLLGIAHRLTCRGIRDVTVIGCDSFEGFPSPSEEDQLENGSFHERAVQGVFADTDYDALRSRIAALGYGGRVELLKGFFVDTLSQLSEVRFSLVHLDCDLYQSYLTCLEFLYPRLLKGGYMVFDEYDTSAPVYPGARKAIDQFLADKPERLECFGEGEYQRWYLVKR